MLRANGRIRIPGDGPMRLQQLFPHANQAGSSAVHNCHQRVNAVSSFAVQHRDRSPRPGLLNQHAQPPGSPRSATANPAHDGVPRRTLQPSPRNAWAGASIPGVQGRQASSPVGNSSAPEMWPASPWVPTASETDSQNWAKVVRFVYVAPTMASTLYGMATRPVRRLSG